MKFIDFIHLPKIFPVLNYDLVQLWRSFIISMTTIGNSGLLNPLNGPGNSLSDFVLDSKAPETYFDFNKQSDHCCLVIHLSLDLSKCHVMYCPLGYLKYPANYNLASQMYYNKKAQIF